MKRLFLLAALSVLMSFAFGQNTKTPASNNLLPNGWRATGSNPAGYDYSIDTGVKYKGKASLTIKPNSKAVNEQFGSLIQGVSADNYRGKRVRLSGYMKTENVEDRSAFWIRVDGTDLSTLDFDNMRNQPPVKGTNDWKKYELVVDVPINAQAIAFGPLLVGKRGQAWFDELMLEVVDNNVSTTSDKLTAEETAKRKKQLKRYRNTKKGQYKRELEIIKTRPQAGVNLDFEDLSQPQQQVTTSTSKPQ